MNKITIIQYNVNHWDNKKNRTLYNTYRHIDPDIILINDTGLRIHPSDFNNTHIAYTENIINRGTAIAIKSHISQRIHDKFETDLLAITIGI